MVEVNVIHDPKGIHPGRHALGLIPPLEDMPMLFTVAIKPQAKGRKQQVHATGQVGPWSPDHQMEMVWHDRKGIDLPSCPDDRGFEGLHEAADGAGVREDGRAVVATGEYVVQSVRVFGAWASGHVTSKQRKRRKTTGPIT